MNKKIILTATILTLPAFLAVWEFISRSGIFNIHLFPPPSIVLKTLMVMIASGELVHDISASIVLIFAGFVIGSGFGICVGMLTGSIKLYENTIGQLVLLIRSIPIIAFVPLFIVWFGIGQISKILLISYGVFIFVWVNTHIGVANIKRIYVNAAKSLGATKKRLIKEIILPAAAPHIIIGLRTGVAVAYIAVVAAELAGASAGLGFRISASHLIFRVDKMIVGLITLGCLGMLSDKILVLTINKFLPWYRLSKEET